MGANNILSKKQQEEDFDRIANNPNSWFTKARTHHLAAKKLFEIYKNTLATLEKEGEGIAPISVNFIDDVLLLEGFAIECLLKGLYIVDGNALSTNGRIINITPEKQHHLIGLCKLNNVELTERETKIIEMLQLMIVGYGRYPTPIKYSLNPRTYNKETGYSPIYIFHFDDLIFIDNLIISIIGDRKDW